MQTIGYWAKGNKELLVALSAYLLAGLLLIGWYRYQINPDGVAYLSIAEKYASGNFHHAVNGYWGPLLSWLLIPFAWLDLNLQTGAKVISLLTGGVVICLGWQILKDWKIGRRPALLALGGLVVLNLYWALPSPLTPDLFIVAVVAAYVHRLGKQLTYKNALLIGITGAIGFYAKSYFLFFFIAHLALWAAANFFTAENKKERQLIIRATALSIATVLLLVSPWVVALTMKYNKLTVSTSGEYNFGLLNPKFPGHPVHYAGLMALPNETAVTAWEDPSYIEPALWNPLKSSENAQHYTRIIFDNIHRTGQALTEFSVYSIAILSFASIGVISRGIKRRDMKVWLLLSATAVYAAGYWLILIEPRYCWPLFFILLLLAACLWPVARSPKLPRTGVTLAIVLLMVSMLYTPITQLYYQRRPNENIRYQAEFLRPHIKPNERIASNSFSTIHHCYYLQVKCLGELHDDPEVAKKELNEHNITAVILLVAENQAPSAYLQQFEQIELQLTDIQLYKRPTWFTNPAQN